MNYNKRFNNMVRKVFRQRPDVSSVAQSRGHGIYCVDNILRYADTKEMFYDQRPCLCPNIFKHPLDIAAAENDQNTNDGLLRAFAKAGFMEYKKSG